MTTFTTRPEILGTFGVCASTHWIASAAGFGILERGGNAFDAAVCMAFTLQVVEPHLNGPGGDMPAIFHSARTGKTEVLCAQGVAPAGATIDAYRARGFDLIPGSGLMATVVPGAFDGWMLMLRDHGTMTLREVLEPAIHYAETGHPMLARVSATIADRRRLLRARNGPLPPRSGCRRRRARAGAALRNPAARRRPSAACWREAEAAGAGARPGRGGPERLYEGFVAEAIDAYCRAHRGHGHLRPQTIRGVMTADDLARWRAHSRRRSASTYGRLDRDEDRTLGPGPGDAPGPRSSSRASIWRRWIPTVADFVHASSRR